MTNTLNICILGASGYTGAELLRLLHTHPHVQIVALTAETQAGKSVGEVYPHLAHAGYPDLVTIEEVDFGSVDVVFCCLPHATTQKVIASLPEDVVVIDLSADFRLHNTATYAQWYGHEHHAPQLQKQAVYGLSEHARDAVKSARLIANPGCYPTSILLPLLPLLKEGIISSENIIADSLSGVSGAGRSAKQNLLFTEVDGGVGAYGVGGHRHVAEIEQELSNVAGTDVTLSFTPHLMPMSRGISSTIHVNLTDGKTGQNAHTILEKYYSDENFVHVLPLGKTPTTHAVRGTNHCHIGVVEDRPDGKLILVSVIDNLVKGASGQAVQNMNIKYNLNEMTGLMAHAIIP